MLYEENVFKVPKCNFVNVKTLAISPPCGIVKLSYVCTFTYIFCAIITQAINRTNPENAANVSNKYREMPILDHIYIAGGDDKGLFNNFDPSTTPD